MSINELKCPSCGASVQPTEGRRIFNCANCGSPLEYDDGIIRTYHETRYVDEAEILKQKVELERIKDKKRQDNQELKRTAVRALGPIILILLVVGFFTMRVRPGYQSDYRGLHYTTAKKQLESTGFWNITCIPVEDIGASQANKDETVIEVHINGTDNIHKTTYRWAKVEIYYHKMPDNPPIKAPEDSGSKYNGWKLQDVVNKLYSVGFAEVYSHVEYDLESVTDGRRGKVFNVTIAGETEWTRNNTRKTYHRNDEVIIYYHDATATAQATPPEGNSTYLIGLDYNLVKARFEEAGFTNIKTVGNNKLTTSSSAEGEVTQVTINGDTEWSYGIGGMLRSTYKRNVPVIITYNSVKEP